MTIVVIEGSPPLPYLLAFQKFPGHGSQTKILGLGLSTIFVIEQTQVLPCHLALSRLPYKSGPVFYLQLARQFESELYTFGRGFPPPCTGG